uniref:PI3K/PI4K catalytic domain-containing protein n=1 Tax=Tetraselmis sp. GSL018 TaxID=582737 RepID=A0A061QN44_9CHLO
MFWNTCFGVGFTLFLIQSSCASRQGPEGTPTHTVSQQWLRGKKELLLNRKLQHSVAAGADYTAIHLHHLLGDKGGHLEHEGPNHYEPRQMSSGLTEKAKLVQRLLDDRKRKEKLPHASTCNFCGKCALVDSAENAALNNGQLGGSVPFLSMQTSTQRNDDEAWKQYARWLDERSALANCTKCRGCTSILNDLKTVPIQFKGHKLKPLDGRSRSFVYRASSERAANGLAIAKTFCLPFSKTLHWRGKPDVEKLEPCDEEFKVNLSTSFYPKIVTAAKIVRDCGFSDVVPNSWIEFITAAVPGTGYVVESDMIMQDAVEGVSLNAVHRRLSNMDGEKLLSGINSTHIVLSAIYDLLLTSEDRHNDNILISSRGKLSLIDNDKILLFEKRIPQSLFLPTTNYYWYNLLGRNFVNTKGGDSSKEPPSYALMLDYRCHVRSLNGQGDDSYTLGTNYPQQVKQCLRGMDSVSAEELMRKYSIPEIEVARHLKERAHDMLHLGFEAALERSTPFCKRWPWTKPCCSWTGRNSHGTEQCADRRWHPDKWKLLNCKKAGGEYQELHSQSNWDYVPASEHRPSIQEAAISQQG